MNEQTIKVLQLFDNYLPITENWASRLLDHTPDAEISIFAKQYLLTNFYSSKFRYIDHLDSHLLRADFILGERTVNNFFFKVGIKLLRKMGSGSSGSLARHLDRMKYDVIHAHFANIGWEFFQTVRKRNIPYVISLYGWDYEKLPFTQPAYKKYFQVMFKECAAFICEGPHGASTLISQGCPEEKIAIIHLGVSSNQIPFLKRKKIKGTLNLVQIAAFSPTKGYLEAIQAFAMVSRDCPNMTYTIVGVERYQGHKEEIEALIKKLQLTEKIKILPKIDFKKIHAFFADFHVFIHPSQYTAEKDCEGGAPIIILDAQSTGMPILSTFHCDIPNEVAHQKTGFLSEEKNIPKLAEHIKRFYFMEQEEYDIMSTNARQKMEKDFDIRLSGKQLAQLYQNVSNKV